MTARTVDIPLRHICEVCGIEAILTPAEAFEQGWDYPPMMGGFGVISERTCPACPINQTVWWALVVNGYSAAMLTEAQRATILRIIGEPETVLVRRH